MLGIALGIAVLLAGPTSASPPSVTGSLQQGAKLTATAGTWSGTGTITYAYQWYRCDVNGGHCSSIHGSTKGTYTLVAKDVGQTIGLTVRATDTTGTTAAYAPLVGLIAAPQATPVATKQPPLSGEPIVGQGLKVEAATWSATPATLTYAWLRCNANGRLCTAETGATTDTYSVLADDVGHVVIAAVTTGKQTVLSLNAGVVRAAPGPVSNGRPAIAGTLQQGAKLTATAGTWSGSGTITYAYQWYRCDASGAHCSSIHGSTKGTYTQVATDVGHTIALTVKATDATGTTAAYSSLAGLVAAKTATLASTAQPTLAGTASVGQALTVTPGTWSGTPSTTFTYAWLHCNANGRLCTAITAATAASYTLTADDSGHTIVATLTATAGTATQAVLTVASPVVA
jgi:fibronectin type 3 domain-containing protein